MEVSRNEAFSTALFCTAQPFERRKRRYSSLVHLLGRGNPAILMKKAFALPETEFPA